MHEVLRVIEERARSGSRPGHRDDGLRIALSIEGGGMRGTVSAGMALALYERGLLPPSTRSTVRRPARSAAPGWSAPTPRGCAAGPTRTTRGR